MCFFNLLDKLNISVDKTPREIREISFEAKCLYTRRRCRVRNSSGTGYHMYKTEMATREYIIFKLRRCHWTDQIEHHWCFSHQLVKIKEKQALLILQGHCNHIYECKYKCMCEVGRCYSPTYLSRKISDLPYISTQRGSYSFRMSYLQMSKCVDVTKWKHFPRNWHFIRGIHRWQVDSPSEGQYNAEIWCFYLRLNKQSSKQSRRWWFETL